MLFSLVVATDKHRPSLSKISPLPHNVASSVSRRCRAHNETRKAPTGLAPKNTGESEGHHKTRIYASRRLPRRRHLWLEVVINYVERTEFSPLGALPSRGCRTVQGRALRREPLATSMPPVNGRDRFPALIASCAGVASPSLSAVARTRLLVAVRVGGHSFPPVRVRRRPPHRSSPMKLIPRDPKRER